NTTQYDLLKNLLTSPLYSSTKEIDWEDRSFCVVGDVDQSIYSWRGANYKLTLGFQKDFPGATLYKLQNNYRSKEPILKAANAIIQNNKQRIDKSLLCTKGRGDKITCFEAADEIEEANYVVSEIKRLNRGGVNPEHMVILYRTNAQSRALEEALMKNNVKYRMFGGVKFYERAEIKDLIAYLRLVFNLKDSAALKRVINTPRRGIGASTVGQIEEKANKLGISLFSALANLLDSGDLGPRVTQSAHEFVELIEQFVVEAIDLTVPELLKQIIDDTQYIDNLKKQETEEADARIENIYELLNVANQFEEESDDKTLEAFLAQVSLVGDSEMAQGNSDDENSVTLMTVHASKGLEFPYVFVTGLEEGIFPHTRALKDTNTSKDELEEERRLLYVAITRAEEKLFLTFARRRRLWGQREFAEPSRFLGELPEDCLVGYWGNSMRSSQRTAFGNLNSKNYQPGQASQKPTHRESMRRNIP
ncbi:MAG TPA: 3'-5' exonuclease, partial [Vampirovibrionales bacterium]